MDKRGEGNELLWNVIMVLLIVMATASMLIWVKNVSSGKLIQAQLGVKEGVLIIDIMRPGTELTLNQNLTLKGSNLISDFEGGSYSYSIFHPKISLQKSHGGTEARS